MRRWVRGVDCLHRGMDAGSSLLVAFSFFFFFFLQGRKGDFFLPVSFTMSRRFLLGQWQLTTQETTSLSPCVVGLSWLFYL